jgi:hypothetical protein
MRGRYVFKLCLAIILTAPLIIGCATQKTFAVKEVRGFYVPNSAEELYGTWLNPDYEGSVTKHAKVTIHSTGFFEAFSGLNQVSPTETGVITIVKKWKGSEGSLWYITFFRDSMGGDSFGLQKVSKNGLVWEGFWTQANVAGSEESLVEENLTAEYPHYQIYDRQR